METAYLRCPICGAPLSRENRSFVCPARHCFDIAKQGYVNLLPVTQKLSKHPGDTRDMVQSRRDFLDQGFYRPIVDRLLALTLPLLPEAPWVLDAGCGEGYYMTQLQARCPAGHFLGVDISKDAVRYAAVRNKQALWAAASAAHLPVQDRSMDLVMSMFALCVPGEFFRVLRPGGIYLEVTAGRDHLLGLKSLIYAQLTEKAPKAAPDYPGFRLLREETLCFPVELTSGTEVQQLLRMTPHVWRITQEGARRAAQAQSLSDTAQVLFRVYQAVAPDAGM